MSATWDEDELNRIAETDDLYISPFREDGETYGTPTWIWSVVVQTTGWMVIFGYIVLIVALIGAKLLSPFRGPLANPLEWINGIVRGLLGI